MVALSGKDVMAWVGLRTWAREADSVSAGIPLTGPVLLGLVADQLGTPGAGRAKRRTTSHPVGPVHTEAGGSGQTSRRAVRATARTGAGYLLARRTPPGS